MWTFVLVVCLAVISISSIQCAPLAVEDDWHVFKQNFNKTYTTASMETHRRLAWKTNVKKIVDHNELFKRGLTKYTMRVNKFSDLTFAEFVATHTGYRKPLANQSITTIGLKHHVVPPGRKLSNPDSIDWRSKGIVTDVKDQGQCGSCWAFSAIGAIEGQHALKTGNLVSLSEQNIIDCDDDDDGCGGGFSERAFDYVIGNGGVDTEDSYEYSGDDSQCDFDDGDVGATISSAVAVDEGDEDALTDAVANVGPVSVAINVADGFQNYDGGVYDDDDCSADDLDHAVLAVGYGSNDDGDYYIVKNSWGQDWGIENGYIYMSRNNDNHCGIASDASYPQV